MWIVSHLHLSNEVKSAATFGLLGFGLTGFRNVQHNCASSHAGKFCRAYIVHASVQAVLGRSVAMTV